MRTTIRINDELYRAVKERAARTDRTIGEVIEDAIRRAYADDGPSDGADVEPLPTFGGSGTMPGVDLTDNAALRDLMEGNEPIHARR